ncbi:MAG: hypothetical protein NC225_07410 [Clostridium sp.]|nr:hypothetical protein [Clostridium sp.]MCM1460750.1 hypothetical protein [Bacteroides sp.]
MELNGVNSSVYTASYSATSSTAKTESVAVSTEDSAVVYEKSEASKKTASATYTAAAKSTGKADTATIEKLKADAEARFSQLQSLVDKLLTKQSETHKYATLGDLMTAVKDGKITVDAATVEQAKKDVAEDGYWGVEQTASRIVDFAKALTGGDAEKIEEMRKAVEKGYKAATKTWGSSLPDISEQTRDRVNELFDQWADEGK